MTSATEWNPTYVDAAGLRLRVGRRGAGRPLLLITGIGAHLEMWAPFVRFVEDRELIAFDPPGAGLSERPRLPLRMRGLARVVADLLDALGLERVDVLGYSFGGALAQELARRAPDRVRRLVLCATGPGLGGSPPRPLAALMLATPARYYHPRLLALTVPHIAGGRTAREPRRPRRAGRGASEPVTGPARLRLPALCGTRLVQLALASPGAAPEPDRGGRAGSRRAAAQRAPAGGATSSRPAARRQGRRAPLPARRAGERHSPIRAFLDEDEGGLMRISAAPEGFWATSPWSAG